MKFIIFAVACLSFAHACEELKTLLNDVADGACGFSEKGKAACEKCVASAKQGSTTDCGIPAELTICVNMKDAVKDLKPTKFNEAFEKCELSSPKDEACKKIKECDHKKLIAEAQGKFKSQKELKCGADEQAKATAKFKDCAPDTDGLKAIACSIVRKETDKMLEKVACGFDIKADVLKNLGKCMNAIATLAGCKQ